MFKFILISFFILLSGKSSWGSDLTSIFQKNYKGNSELSPQEIEYFKNYNFVLVPGILSETFIWKDDRSLLDFSFLTKDYFSTQLKFLKKNGMDVQRLNSSSFSVDEIKRNLRKALSVKSKKT